MLRRWLYLLNRVGWEFWVPLPVLALLLLWGGNLMAKQVMGRPYGTVGSLQMDTQLQTKLAVTVLVIKADINAAKQLTKVSVKTMDSTLKKLEYEFPVTDAQLIESAIAQELAIPVGQVRKLTRYRIVG